jgi:hypothetical protein
MSDRALTVRFEGGPRDGVCQVLGAGTADEVFVRSSTSAYVEEESGRVYYDLRDVTGDTHTFAVRAPGGEGETGAG